MSDEKEEKGKEKREEGKEEDVQGLVFSRIKVGSELAKMSVEDAVRKEGILPFNPIEIADEETTEKLGRQAGVVYGAAAYTLWKAGTRDDLPVDKRVRLAMKGARPLLSMILQGVDTVNRFNAIEDAILHGEDLETSQKRRYTPSARDRRTPSDSIVSAADVVYDLKKRLTELEEENTALKAGKKKDTKAKAF